MSAPAAPVLVAQHVRKEFARARGEVAVALDDVSFEVQRGQLTALVGPDGAGKTTLMRLATGLLKPDRGALSVLGLDAAREPQRVQAQIAYMPQRFGLYEDLSAAQNLELYADLHAVPAGERRALFARLMQMTRLAPFTARLAGKLSGGMKQKLGLACALVRSPELLLLDEPTVGVDPVSRRELWQIIEELVQAGLSVLVSTSYLDEAERCASAVVLNAGRVLALGTPGEVRALAAGRTFAAAPRPAQRARELQALLLDLPETVDAVPEGGRVRLVTTAGAHPERESGALAGLALEPVPARFEDGFMILLQPEGRGARTRAARAASAPKAQVAAQSAEPVVQVRELTRTFGSFTAVERVSFDVRAGEIFGLLGPNGAGKTTTFRMLCGLLPATHGSLRVAGVDVRRARASARARIGYVAQKFSLYGQLSVRENLAFFAGAYGLRGARRRAAVELALADFDLAEHAARPCGGLPGGFKQRLAMAAALMHGPELLFLDEPTSGADPQARREFWRRITDLSAAGVSVIVTTHFMEEAEYCDRAVILDAGRILAEGTPRELRAQAEPRLDRPADMEDAFIAIVERARRAEGAA